MFNETITESTIHCSEACSALFRSIRASNSLEQIKWLMESSIPGKIIVGIKQLEELTLKST